MDAAERLLARLGEIAPVGFKAMQGAPPQDHVIVVVREENPGLVLTAYNLTRDVDEQVDEDICEAHRAYLCPLCFDLGAAS